MSCQFFKMAIYSYTCRNAINTHTCTPNDKTLGSSFFNDLLTPPICRPSNKLYDICVYVATSSPF